MMQATHNTFFERKNLLCLLLCMVPALVYLQSLFYGFSPMDEQWLIVRDAEYMKDWHSLRDAFRGTIQGIYYRPVLLVTLIIDSHTGNISPFAFHLTNILLHIFSVLLLFRFLLLLGSGNRTAFLLALIFSVHPLSLNAVAWVPGRNDSLLCIFTLGSLMAFINYLRSNRLPWFLLHVFLFIVALLTKESSVILPLVFVIVYFTFKPFSKKLLLMALAWAAPCIAWFLVRNSLITFYPLENANYPTAIGKFVLAYFSFGGKAILPVNQSIAPTLKNSLLWPGALLLLLIGWAFYSGALKDRKIAIMGLCFYIVLLSIPAWFGAVSPLGIHDEHRSYTPLVGLLVFASQLRFESRPVLVTAAWVIAGLFAFKILWRIDVYKSPENYTAEGVKDCPENFIFSFHQGEVYYRQKKYRKAIEHFNKAIELRGNMAQLYHNRGNAHLELHMKKEAIADYSRALQLSDYSAQVYMSRCLCYRIFGETDKCLEDMMAINEKYPGYMAPELQNRIREEWADHAIAEIGKMMARDPDNALLYANRARHYANKGQLQQALADLEKACRLDPGNESYRGYYKTVESSLRLMQSQLSPR